jgi:hypothetical protein
LAHNIAIKRYCNKKIFLSHWFLLAMVSSYQTTNRDILSFVQSLPWLVTEIHGSKIFLIAILSIFFIAVLYAKKSCVNKTLMFSVSYCNHIYKGPNQYYLLNINYRLLLSFGYCHIDWSSQNDLIK